MNKEFVVLKNSFDSLAKVKRAEKNSSSVLVDSIIKGMQEKKAENIVVIDLTGLFNPISDFLVICSGNSDTQVEAITEEIEKEVFKTKKEDPWLSEGKDQNHWVILDYVDVVAHIFVKDKREFFALEELWGDARIKEIDSQPETEKTGG